MMNATKNFQHPSRRAAPRRQHGVVLVFALIALLALMLAGIAIVRSIDTGNLISGNMAFRQAALQSSDIGVQAAYIALPTIVATSKDADIPNTYFALRQATDSSGVPTTVNWADVACRNNLDGVVTCTDQEYQVKYIIDRMCDRQVSGSTTVTDVQGYCFADIAPGKGGGSKGVFGEVITSADAIYYRVTVQVTGPRNTVAYVQVLISKS
jgi:type IV pilus assembly protein PilX